MNIVIPMAGNGNRFLQAGYKNPKPFVEVNGTFMIRKVLDNIKIPKEAKLIIICLEKLFDEWGVELEKICADLSERYSIIKILKATEGAVCTILKAQEFIDKDELVIANCDQIIFQPNFFQNSLDFFKRRKVDGGILCFYSRNPRHSYIDLDEQGQIIHIAEKEVISDFATVGIYYYKKRNDFIRNANCMIRENNRTNNEFYVAPVFNYMIERDGAKVLPYLVNEMYEIGKPEDLKIFEKMR